MTETMTAPVSRAIANQGRAIGRARAGAPRGGCALDSRRAPAGGIEPETLDTPVVRLDVMPRMMPGARRSMSFQIERGETIWEILGRAGVDPDREPLPLLVTLGDGVVPKELWKRVRPKAGTILAVRVLPGGGDGGKQVLAIVAMIAIIVFAAWAGPALAAGMGLTEAGGALTTAGMIVSATTQAAIVTAGAMGISAMTPPPSQSNSGLSGGIGRDSPTLFIEGTRNANPAWRPVPEVLGRYRYTPPFGALPWTETEGDDQYVREMFCPGYGPLEIETLKIGETATSKFEGVELQIRRGFPDDPPLTLYCNSPKQDRYSVRLTKVLGEAAVPVIRTARRNANEIIIDITFPSGLGKIKEEGKRKSAEVEIRVETSPAGENDWTDQGILLTRAKKFSAAVRNSMRIVMEDPEPQYDVRLTRLTDDMRGAPDNGDDTYIDESWLTAIMSVVYGDPLRLTRVARIAGRFKATDQLNGIIDEFNCMCRSIVPDWGSYDLFFDGVDDWVDFGDPTGAITYDGTQYALVTGWRARTVQCWAKVDSGGTTDNGGIWQAGAVTGAYADFSLNVAEGDLGADWFQARLGTSLVFNLHLPGLIGDGQWHHFAMTYDLFTARVYVDGELQQEADVALATPAVADGSALKIGKWANTHFMEGMIRDFRIYDVARDAETIQGDWNAVLTGTEPNLRAWLPMEEGEKSIVYDHTGHAHGTLAGMQGSHWSASARAKRWVPRPTNNNASLYRRWLQGPSARRPLADGRLDLAGLQEWHELVGSPSTISWYASVNEQNFRVEARASLDGGATWTDWGEAANGGAIPGLAAGADASSGRLQVRQVFETDHPRTTPILWRLDVRVNGTLAAAQDLDDSQAEFAAGTLDNVTAVEEGAVRLSRPQEALMATFDIGIAVNGFMYLDLTDVTNRTILAGDCLEYDLFWAPSADNPDLVAIDLGATDTTNLRNTAAVDQNGLSAHPGTDLTEAMAGWWYHRKIDLAPFAGKTVDKWLIGCESNGGATLQGLIKNVQITDGAGSQRKAVWMSGDALPAWAVVETSAAGNSATVRARSVATTATGTRTSPELNLSSCGTVRLPGGFNHVVDYKTSTREVLKLICASAFASYMVRDGKHGVLVERPQAQAVAFFTPRNSRNFRGHKTFQEAVHGLRFKFTNSETWVSDERTIYADGYDEDTATQIVEMDLQYATTPADVWVLGRRQLAQLILRPETFEFETDFEYLRCLRGDRIELTHDAVLIGLSAGRIKSIALDGEGKYIASLELDETVTMEEGKGYGLQVRDAGGNRHWMRLATVAGDSATVTPYYDTEPLFAAGDFFSYGEAGEESAPMLVTEIHPAEDLSARVVCCNYDDGVYTADAGAIPAFESKITLPPGIESATPLPEVESVVSDESAMVRMPDGTWQTRVIITLKRRPGQQLIERINVQWRDVDVEIQPWENIAEIAATDGRIVLTNLEQGYLYDIRLRSISADGKTFSAWMTIWGHFVQGKMAPPPDVGFFRVSESPEGARIFEWSATNRPFDFDGVQVRFGQGAGLGWDEMAPLFAEVMRDSPIYKMGLAAGSYTFGIKSIDTSGNLSTNAVTRTIVFNIEPGGNHRGMVFDLRAMGWPGTQTNCHEAPVDPADPEYPTVGPLMANAKAAHNTWDKLSGFWWADWLTWQVEAEDLLYVYDGTLIPRADFRVSFEIEWEGELYNLDSPPAGVFFGSTLSQDNILYSNNRIYLSALFGAGGTIRMGVRIKQSSGGVAGKLKRLVFRLDMDQRVETVWNIDTSSVATRIATGKFRIPLTGHYAAGATSVQIVFKNEDTADWSFRVVDYQTDHNEVAGPQVWIYKDGVLADTMVDAIVSGFQAL